MQTMTQYTNRDDLILAKVYESIDWPIKEFGPVPENTSVKAVFSARFYHRAAIFFSALNCRTETRYSRRVCRFLRDDLGCKILFTEELK